MYQDSTFDDRRESRRLQRRYRVTSRFLPGGEAFTVNVSRTGLMLETLAPPEIERMRLVLETDPGPFESTVRVCWCRPLGERYLVGVQHERLEPEARAKLEALLAASVAEG